MTKTTIKERNAQIIQLSNSGLSVKALSKKFDICEKYIMEIINGGLESARTQAIRAAEDFGYGDEVLAQLNAAKNVDDISRIMRKARIEMFG